MIMQEEIILLHFFCNHIAFSSILYRIFMSTNVPFKMKKIKVVNLMVFHIFYELLFRSLKKRLWKTLWNV